MLMKGVEVLRKHSRIPHSPNDAQFIERVYTAMALASPSERIEAGIKAMRGDGLRCVTDTAFVQKLYDAMKLGD